MVYDMDLWFTKRDYNGGVPRRRREAGGGSPGERLLVIRIEVIRVVAMVMEKRGTLRIPRAPLPRGGSVILERILKLEPPRAVSFVHLFILTLWFCPNPSSSREAVPVHHIRAGDTSVSPHHTPL